MKVVVHYLENGKRRQRTIYFSDYPDMSKIVREFIQMTGLSRETYIDNIEFWCCPGGLRHVCRWRYKAYTAFKSEGANND